MTRSIDSLPLSHVGFSESQVPLRLVHSRPSHPSDPSSEDVDAAVAGDEGAATRIARQLVPRVRNLVRYLVRDDRDVDDMSQEALIAVLRGLSSYRGDGRFLSWADRVVARSTFHSLKRRRVREHRFVELDELSPNPSGEQRTARSEDFLQRRQLATALDGLPDEQRHTLVLHHVLSMTVPEIAAEMQIPGETVRSRLRLGRQRLRAQSTHAFSGQGSGSTTRGGVPVTLDPTSSDDNDLFLPLDDAVGPALPASEAALDAAAQAAVASAFSSPRFQRRRSRKPVLLMAAIVVLPSMAAALVVSYSRSSAPPTIPPADTSASTMVVPSPSPSATKNKIASQKPEVAETAAPQPNARAGEGTKETKDATTSPQIARKSAKDMLKKANGIRRSGRWAEAASTYSKVAERFPGTAQASVASLAAASLNLEHLGNPSEALRLYRRARKSPGLASEAALGIAKSYRALGDRSSELQALESLVETYPNALFRKRADARLRELRGAQP